MSTIDTLSEDKLNSEGNVNFSIDWLKILNENKLSLVDLPTHNIHDIELERIFLHFNTRKDAYEQFAESISKVALKFNSVHSVRYRIKNSNHLISKIVRKKKENPDRNIVVGTYEEEITDLVGIRILYLSKEDFFSIDKLIRKNFDFRDDELPKIFYRAGDADSYDPMKFNRIEHTHGYRSAHYIIKRQHEENVIYAELQVRTIFEEGWSEIDHKIMYPYNLDNFYLKQFSRILNTMSGNADELASLMLSSITKLDEIKQPLQQIIKDQDKKLNYYERLIRKSNLQFEEKAFLRMDILSQYQTNITDAINTFNNNGFKSAHETLGNSRSETESSLAKMTNSFRKSQFEIQSSINAMLASINQPNLKYDVTKNALLNSLTTKESLGKKPKKTKGNNDGI